MLSLVTCFRRRRLKNLQEAIKTAKSAIASDDEVKDVPAGDLHSEMLVQLEKKRDKLRYKLGEIPYPIPEIPFQPNR